MQPDRLLISAAPGEVRLALMSGDALVEILHQRPGDRPVEGAVFRGRVRKINRDLNAAFVDIGGPQPGFLSAQDARRTPDMRIRSIADVLSEGDAVVVQADREALAGKGPRLTCRPILAGRYLNLHLGSAGLRVPRTLARAERERLKTLEDFLPGGIGASFNPAAGGAADQALRDELDRLMMLAEAIRAPAGRTKAPDALVPAPAPFVRALSLCATDCRVVTDDPEMADLVRNRDLAAKIDIWTGPDALFEVTGVEAALEAALQPTVDLPGGGRLLISETPALVAIDVDTGRATEGQPARLAAKTNRQAVAAVARELRLRNLSGQVFIDFLASRGKKERQDLLRLLRNALSADPVECHVLGFTALGLAELTRRRRGPSLGAYLGGPAGWAPSPETAALAALRAASRAGGGRVVLRVAPDVAGALNGPAKDARAQAEARLGGALAVEERAELAPRGFEVV